MEKRSQVLISWQSDTVKDPSAKAGRDQLLAWVALESRCYHPWFKQGVPWASMAFLPELGIGFSQEPARRTGQRCVANGTASGRRRHPDSTGIRWPLDVGKFYRTD